MALAFVGKMEMTQGIHAVFRHVPLTWTHGYLARALAVMETVSTGTGDVKISTDVVSTFSHSVFIPVCTHASYTEPW